MVQIQDKLVDVKGLAYVNRDLTNWINQICADFDDKLNNKLGKATNIPVPGQVLVADSNFRWSWKDPQGSSSSVDEATVRRIVNEQLAKMKFTVNDQGHLIIETPEA